ncbi:MAG: hypothetical protein AAB466_14700 [Verrucomicrobiota bacterium]
MARKLRVEYPGAVCHPLALRPRSIQPVLHAQAGDVFKVHHVARQQRSLMRHADGGDLEIHRPGARMLTFQVVEDFCGLGVEGKNGKLVEGGDGL